MTTKATLCVALSKLQANYLNISKAMASARAQISDLDPKVREAAMLLVETYKHPEGVMSIVKSIGQASALEETKTEIEALIVSLQVSIGEVSDEKLDAQLAANAEVLESPLPSAGAGSELAPANQATLDQVSTAATQAGNASDSEQEVS